MVAQPNPGDLVKNVGKGLAASLVAGYSFIVLLGFPHLVNPSIPTLREVLLTFPLLSSFFTAVWVGIFARRYAGRAQ